MSTYVQLVDRLRVECGTSGATILTLAGQVAEVNRLAGWINQSWLSIQEMHEDWFFLRQSFSFNTTQGVGSISALAAGIPVAPGLGVWKRDSVRIFLTSQGFSNESFLPFQNYESFRDLWLFSAMRTQQTRPTMFSIDPQFNMLLGALPDSIYTVNGDYFQAPSRMVADSDVPVMPARWHDLIVFRAMQHYGMYEAASEVLQRGQTEFNKMLSPLMAQQLPTMTFGPPLC